MDRSTLSTRDNFGKFLNALNLVGPGAEIGVFRGEFAQTILAQWEGGPLHLIDPWRRLPNYHDSCNLPDRDMESALDEARQRTSGFGDRTRFVRALSLEASVLFPDMTLDFVYIDANHSYTSVCADLTAWYRKVRPGGLIAGHDYYNALATPEGDPVISSDLSIEKLTSYGVKSAVDQFVQDLGLKLYLSQDEWPTWYAFRPFRVWTRPRGVAR